MLRALGGESEDRPRFTMARLEEEVRVKAGLTRFLPATVESSFRGAHVKRIAWQGSGDLAAAAKANGFLVVPETSEHLAVGEIVTVLEI
jgi:molybdopterin molybdotransferase